MLTVTIDRSGLSLPDLVIYDHPNRGDFWVDEEGITWPGFPVRRQLAPESLDMDGDLVLGFTRGSGQMSLTVYTHGADLAELRANMLELEAAVYQYDFAVTLSLSGMPDEVYRAMPTLPLWGDMDSGEVRGLMVDGQLVVPLNPPVVA